eukprot:1337471-Rhodomonas_salina.1
MKLDDEDYEVKEKGKDELPAPVEKALQIIDKWWLPALVWIINIELFWRGGRIPTLWPPAKSITSSRNLSTLCTGTGAFSFACAFAEHAKFGADRVRMSPGLLAIGALIWILFKQLFRYPPSPLFPLLSSFASSSFPPSLPYLPSQHRPVLPSNSFQLLFSRTQSLSRVGKWTALLVALGWASDKGMSAVRSRIKAPTRTTTLTYPPAAIV